MKLIDRIFLIKLPVVCNSVVFNSVAVIYVVSKYVDVKWFEAKEDNSECDVSILTIINNLPNH